MPDPNLPLLEDAVHKLAPFLEEIVFVGGITLGLLITDKAAAPIRGTNDVDVIAEIVTYADYIAFSERLREAHFTEDAGENPLTCRWHNGALTLDVLALNEEVLGFTNTWYEPALRHAFTVTLQRRYLRNRDFSMCFQDLSWITSESPLFKSVSRQLQRGLPELAETKSQFLVHPSFLLKQLQARLTEVASYFFSTSYRTIL